MNVLSSNPDETEKELTAKIHTWLRGQGYPLEMRVARGLADAGFLVTQSNYYRDSDTGKLREIDVVARRGAQTESPSSDPNLWTVAIFVECKRSEDKPWVLFTSTGRSLASRRARPATPRASTLIAQFPDAWTGTLLDDGVVPLAYGVTQAFTAGSDMAFSACHGALKSAAAEIRLLVDHFKVGDRVASVAIPLVVIDGLLFEAHLDRDDVRVAPIDAGAVVWPSGDDGESYAVDVVSTGGLEEFQRRAHATFVRLESVIAQASPQIR